MAKYKAKAIFYVEVTVNYVIDMDEWEGDDDATSRAVMADEEANIIDQHLSVEITRQTTLGHSYETTYEVVDIQPEKN
jgi:hypothetical protein